MKLERLPPIKSSLQRSNHPYLSGAWTPQHEEVSAWDLEVIEGTIPADIDGIYLRNTENQVHQPLGRHHPFDGDAMLHQISFEGGVASYRNRFVRTRCFEAEQIAGGSLWGGLADPWARRSDQALARMAASRTMPAPTLLCTLAKRSQPSINAASLTRSTLKRSTN